MSDVDLSDDAIVDAMQRYGGSFAKALADLWCLADDDNRARIKAGWPHYWATYSEYSNLARALKARTGARA